MANENTEAASGTSAANNQVFIKSKPSEKFFYPLQGVGGSVFIWTFLSGFITMYYTNSVMIGAAAVGTMMLIARVLDGFTDIIMGIILEKTNWKMGNRFTDVLSCACRIFLWSEDHIYVFNIYLYSGDRLYNIWRINDHNVYKNFYRYQGQRSSLQYLHDMFQCWCNIDVCDCNSNPV